MARLSKDAKLKKEKSDAAWRKQYCSALRENSSPPLIASPESLTAVCPAKSVFDGRWKKLDDELQERENIALDEAEARALAMAPAYSKGAYQPISLSDLNTIGKKF